MVDLSRRSSAAISDGSMSSSSNQTFAKRISSSDSFLYGSRRAAFIGAGAGGLAGIAVQNWGARTVNLRSGLVHENALRMHEPKLLAKQRQS